MAPSMYDDAGVAGMVGHGDVELTRSAAAVCNDALLGVSAFIVIAVLLVVVVTVVLVHALLL